MKVELSKEDLIALVKGTDPSYKAMGDPLVSRCGYYTGGFVERWTWEGYMLATLTEEELFALYNLVKNS